MNFKNCIVIVLFTCFTATNIGNEVKENDEEIMKSASHNIEEMSEKFITIRNWVKNETVSFDHAIDHVSTTLLFGFRFFRRLHHFASSMFFAQRTDAR